MIPYPKLVKDMEIDIWKNSSGNEQFKSKRVKPNPKATKKIYANAYKKKK